MWPACLGQSPELPCQEGWGRGRTPFLHVKSHGLEVTVGQRATAALRPGHTALPCDSNCSTASFTASSGSISNSSMFSRTAASKVSWVIRLEAIVIFSSWGQGHPLVAPKPVFVATWGKGGVRGCHRLRRLGPFRPPYARRRVGAASPRPPLVP